MHPHHIDLYCCPKCQGSLSLHSAEQGPITNGQLVCGKCQARYTIQDGVPRFVPQANYSSSFGFQWNLHAKTQYDSFTGVPVSTERLFKETRWPKTLTGQKILEVGSGSGRFTEALATTGATVVSIDYSSAVLANFKGNGEKSNVTIAQGSVYELPVRPQSFDKVLCLGVLQHTPDVQQSFRDLCKALKPGGELVIDVYRHRLVNFLWPRYWIRPLTRRMNADSLYRLCEKYVHFMWPLSKLIHRLPQGRKLNRWLLVPDFRDVYPLSEELLKSWAILDTFDNLSPAYDQPQTLQTVRAWFEAEGFESIDVHFGYNGIEGRGRKPDSSLAISV